MNIIIDLKVWFFFSKADFFFNCVTLQVYILVPSKLDCFDSKDVSKKIIIFLLRFNNDEKILTTLLTGAFLPELLTSVILKWIIILRINN